MYESFYGLKSKPFQLNPDPDFYFSSKQHKRARAYLEYGVMRCEGFIVVTGEVGAGKTTVVRGLLESLDAENVVAANLVSTQVDAEDTLKLVAAAFGIQAKGESKADLLMSLEAFFISNTMKGKRCLLIVDEAQNLLPKVVEELRMLSNFQSGKKALLQTFLVGQPEFRDILQSPDMLQLRQRVTATCHLGPLDQDETREYIKHRLRCAGSTEKPVLDLDIFEDIYSYTGGIPRRINGLMDRVLLNGFLTETNYIDKNLVQQIIEELNSEISAPEFSVNENKNSNNKNNINKDRNLDAREPHLQFDEDFSESISQKIFNVSCENMISRIMRIEHSVLRQERLSLEILITLQKLVSTNKEKSKAGK